MRQQTQARGAGRRDERRRLAGGRCRQRPGGWYFALGKEVGSGYKRERGCNDKLYLWGGSRIEGENDKIQKVSWDRWDKRVKINCDIGDGA